MTPPPALTVDARTLSRQFLHELHPPVLRAPSVRWTALRLAVDPGGGDARTTSEELAIQYEGWRSLQISLVHTLVHTPPRSRQRDPEMHARAAAGRGRQLERAAQPFDAFAHAHEPVVVRRLPLLVRPVESSSIVIDVDLQSYGVEAERHGNASRCGMADRVLYGLADEQHHGTLHVRIQGHWRAADVDADIAASIEPQPIRELRDRLARCRTPRCRPPADRRWAAALGSKRSRAAHQFIAVFAGAAVGEGDRGGGPSGGGSRGGDVVRDRLLRRGLA
jgi:hypothetical protein